MDFKYGEIVATPPNIAPPESWSEYGLIADPLGICAREWVGVHPRGVRWSIWPLCFEEYVSDTEPDLLKSKEGILARNRAVSWKRIARTDIPNGWHKLSSKPWRIDGFHTLTPGVDYKEKWFKNARREVRLWEENFLQKYCTIEDISIEEFTAAYLNSTAAQKAGTHLLKILSRKYALPEVRKHISLWGVRDIRTKRIVAGTAALYSPTQKSTVRYCPFMLEQARSTYASTGLVDYWFAESKKKGMDHLLFTCFWQPGDPNGWKGPAEFKSHFGLEYVAYPPTLTRFVSGKLL